MSDRHTAAERRKRYTRGVTAPSSTRAISGGGIAVLLLLVLIPPLGLLLMWGQNRFMARGRAILTTLATVEMACLIVLFWPKQPLINQLPVPAAPPAVTAAPVDKNLDALYNIEQLIYEQQLAKVKAAGGDERDLMTEEEKLNEDAAANEAILDTTVYSVYRNARYYHVSKVCQTQTNGRELTIREAMRESLAPCPNCNPPVPSA